METGRLGLMRTVFRVILVAGCAVLAGCSAEAKRTGFLSTYAHLDGADGGKVFVAGSDAIDQVQRVYVEPVELRLDSKSNVSDEQARQIAAELHEAMRAAIGAHREVVGQGDGTAARFRMALTRIRKGVWLLNLHPGTKMTGAGLGGAAIEAELVDAEGRQLWAMVEMRKGDRAELDAFSELDDARDAINAWAQQIEALFSEGER